MIVATKVALGYLGILGANLAAPAAQGYPTDDVSHAFIVIFILLSPDERHTNLIRCESYR